MAGFVLLYNCTPLTPQHFSAILELMNEIEKIKETTEGLTKETPKEPKIQKFYNFCGFIQNIFLAIVIVTVLGGAAEFLTNGIITDGSTGMLLFFVLPILSLYSILITFLISLLLIIIGIVFYFNKKDITKKSYGKKFIMKGIIVLIPISIIFFIIGIIYVP